MLSFRIAAALGSMMTLLGPVAGAAEDIVPVPVERPWSAALSESLRRGGAIEAPSIADSKLEDAGEVTGSITPAAGEGSRAKRHRPRGQVQDANAAVQYGQDYPQAQGLFVNSSNLALPPARGRTAGQ